LIPYLNCRHGLKSNVLALGLGLEQKFVEARVVVGSEVLKKDHLYSRADVTEEIQYQDSYRQRYLPSNDRFQILAWLFWIFFVMLLVRENTEMRKQDL
jgi:hypothetical protein